MSHQFKPSVTNPTIAEIYQDIKSAKLNLKPDFQRKFVWTHEHQEAFIDTILHGYPFPEIYVCQGTIDTEKLKTTQHVIDGQQRLTTIKNYIEETFEKPLKTVTPFKDLSENEREDFLYYQIVVRDIGKVDDKDIREIFRRINLTKFKLEDVEIHNAVYDGIFIQTAKEILDNISLEQYGVFHESELTRMADLHFILLIMSTIENKGYFLGDNEIETFIAQYNDDYQNSSHIKSLLMEVFTIIEQLKLPVDSVWFRKSSFFTLIVEIAKNISNLPENFREKLLQFEQNLFKGKGNKDSDYSIYYSYMYSGTTNRKARVERARIFNKEIIMTPLNTPDHFTHLEEH